MSRAADQRQLECAEALQQMQQFLDRELDETTMDAIRVHLDACEHCIEGFDAEAMLKEIVKRCWKPSDVSAPDNLRLKITQRTVSYRIGD